MGGWFSRESVALPGGPEAKDLVVVNESLLFLNLWCNGGGPIAHVRPGEAKQTKLPPHLVCRDGAQTHDYQNSRMRH